MLSMYFAAGKQDTGKRKGLTMLTVVGVIITGALGETFFFAASFPGNTGFVSSDCCRCPRHLGTNVK